MNKLLLVLLLTFISFLKVYSTAQEPDIIIYEGKEYALFSNPLEDFFRANPEKRPTSNLKSTGNWRGYVATFTFKDSLLYLTDIQIDRFINEEKSLESERISVMHEIFGEEMEIKVDWYSGFLIMPYGKMINYIHYGYESVFRNYHILLINKGKIDFTKKMRHKDFVPFKNKIDLIYKGVSDFLSEIENSIKKEDYEKKLKELMFSIARIELKN